MENYYAELVLPDPALHHDYWGHTDDLYLRALYAIIRKEKPMLAVELGTYRGYSTNAIAEALKANLAENLTKRAPLLITVDLHDDHQYGAPPGLTSFVHVVKGDTGSESLAESLMAPYRLHGTGTRPIDFLFIDADHRYASVARDYETWAGFVRPGGLIAFHDIRDLEGTRQHWQEMQQMYPGLTAMMDDNQMGLLRVPDPPVTNYISPRKLEAPPPKKLDSPAESS